MSVNNLQLCADPKASKDTKYVRLNNDDFEAKKKKNVLSVNAKNVVYIPDSKSVLWSTTR